MLDSPACTISLVCPNLRLQKEYILFTLNLGVGIRKALLAQTNLKDDGSLISKLRKERNILFKNSLESLVKKSTKKIRILDVGGEARFWQNVDFDISKYDITVINLLYSEEKKVGGITTKYGNALDLSFVPKESVDVIFSNSVIEHVGSWQDQITMAKQVLSFEAPIFLQTPNYWFPMEPHFLFPFFQFLPLKVRAFLLYNFNLGEYGRMKPWERALTEVKMVKLLKKRELLKLFPSCTIRHERVMGLTSGFLVFHGWTDNNLGPLTR